MSGAVDPHDIGPVIVATVTLPNCTPGRALTAFTDPALVARWWRGELKQEPANDGPYTVDFPAIPARLTGRVLSFDPGRSLEFTWSWDDQPPDSTVQITVEPSPDATSALLKLKHGPPTNDGAGQIAHQEHWDGWQYFLPRLAAELRHGP